MPVNVGAEGRGGPLQRCMIGQQFASNTVTDQDKPAACHVSRNGRISGERQQGEDSLELGGTLASSRDISDRTGCKVRDQQALFPAVKQEHSTIGEFAHRR